MESRQEHKKNPKEYKFPNIAENEITRNVLFSVIIKVKVTSRKEFGLLRQKNDEDKLSSLKL